MTFQPLGSGTPLAERLDPRVLAKITGEVSAAAGERLAVRAAAPRHPLTVAGLLAVTRVTESLAEHLMHHHSRGGYCVCAVHVDVEPCTHAVDLGLVAGRP